MSASHFSSVSHSHVPCHSALALSSSLAHPSLILSCQSLTELSTTLVSGHILQLAWYFKGNIYRFRRRASLPVVFIHNYEGDQRRMSMASEKINKTAEKETISNCKRAAGRAFSLFGRFPDRVDVRVHHILLPPTARRSVRKASENRQFWHKDTI